MVCPPWRCSDAPQRALTPAHECDSERGTDAAAAAAKKKKEAGEGGGDAEGWSASAHAPPSLPAAPPPFRYLAVLRVSAAFLMITREL